MSSMMGVHDARTKKHGGIIRTSSAATMILERGLETDAFL